MAGNTVVVHILGETRGLTKALLVAQKNIVRLGAVANDTSRLVGGIGIAFAATAAAGVAAGAVAAASVLAMTSAIGGGLIYFAAKNEEVKKSFSSLKEHVSNGMQEMTKNLVEPLKNFATQAKGAFDSLGPSIGAISAMLAPLITQIGDKLTPLAEKLGPMLVSAFEAGQGPLLAFVDGLGPLIDGFKQFFDILKDPVVSEFTTTLMQSLGLILPILAQLLVALTPIGTEILQALVPAFQHLTDFISANVVPIMQSLTDFLTDHPGLITALAAVWVVAKVAMLGIWTATLLTNIALLAFSTLTGIIRVATLLWAAAQWILNAAMLGFPLVWIIAAVVAVIAIIALLVIHWDTVKAFLINCWNAIKETAIATWGAITEFLSMRWEQMKAHAINAWNAIKSFLSSTWNSLQSFVSSTWSAITSTISSAWNSITSITSSTWNSIKNYVTNAVNGLRDAVSSGLNAVRSTFTSVFGSIMGYIRGLVGQFVSMGAALIQGLINGVGSMAGALIGKVRSLAESAVSAMKGALGINSPSRVFRQLGRWTGEGLIAGIGDEEKKVAKAIWKLSAQAIDAVNQKPFYKSGVSIGESIAQGIVKAAPNVSDAVSGLSSLWDTHIGDINGRIKFDPAVEGAGPGATFNIHVQAGIASAEETGRAVVDAISKYESINGNRWRN